MAHKHPTASKRILKGSLLQQVEEKLAENWVTPDHPIAW